MSAIPLLSGPSSTASLASLDDDVKSASSQSFHKV